MELVQYLRVLRRRWRVIAALIALGMLSGLLIGYLSTKSKEHSPASTSSLYSATHTLLGTKNTNLLQMATLTTDGEVPRRVADRLGGSPAALAADVVAVPKPEASLIQITAVGQNPQRVVQTADTFAEELVSFQSDVATQERESLVGELQRQRDDLRAEYEKVFKAAAEDTNKDNQELYKRQKDDVIRRDNDMARQIEQAQKSASTPGALTTLSTAEPIAITSTDAEKVLAQKYTKNAKQDDTRPSSSGTLSAPRSIGMIPASSIGAILGLFLGIALVLLIERLDPRLRTKDQAEQIFGWPVVAELPPLSRSQRRRSDVLSFDEPRGRTAEAYRALRGALLFAGSDRPHSNRQANLDPPSSIEPLRASAAPGGQDSPAPKQARVVMVTSPGPSEGKTTSTANLAATLGEVGYSVLVLNCDFRRPRVNDYLHCDQLGSTPSKSIIPNVQLIDEVLEDPDSANPAVIIAEQRRIIAESRASFDIILLDTAPLLSTSDAAELLDITDQVVIIGRVGRTGKEAADRAAELLERRNAPVVGVALVGATDSPRTGYYYYGSAGPYTTPPEAPGPGPKAEHTTQEDNEKLPAPH